jgi:hypothetical protein
MSEYFSYFPTTQHDLTNDGQTVTLTNILRRFIVRSDVVDRTDVFYKYDITAGDRPDTIAEKYYGDPNLAWVVLHFNNIVDPIFGWYLADKDFDNYVKGKYGSISTAQSTVHEYRQVLNERSVRYDGTIIEKRTVGIDQTTYDSLAEASRESISKYDYEVAENEKRRTIQILDKRYLDKVREEVQTVLQDGI